MSIVIGRSGYAANAIAQASAKTPSTTTRTSAAMTTSGIIRALTPSAALPYAVAFLAQRDGELHLRVSRAIVRHRVVGGVELGHEAQAVEHHVAVRLDAGLVLVE